MQYILSNGVYSATLYISWFFYALHFHRGADNYIKNLNREIKKSDK